MEKKDNNKCEICFQYKSQLSAEDTQGKISRMLSQIGEYTAACYRLLNARRDEREAWERSKKSKSRALQLAAEERTREAERLQAEFLEKFGKPGVGYLPTTYGPEPYNVKEVDDDGYGTSKPYTGRFDKPGKSVVYVNPFRTFNYAYLTWTYYPEDDGCFIEVTGGNEARDFVRDLNSFCDLVVDGAMVTDVKYAGAKGKPSGHCYVATCAYGSYDCPEVWTLRRFRDERLSASAPGRLFIRLYYLASPALVRAFGGSEAFRSAVRRPLDRFVARLRREGFSGEPYED